MVLARAPAATITTIHPATTHHGRRPLKLDIPSTETLILLPTAFENAVLRACDWIKNPAFNSELLTPQCRVLTRIFSVESGISRLVVGLTSHGIADL
jgi:hypothetical protein